MKKKVNKGNGYFKKNTLTQKTYGERINKILNDMLGSILSNDRLVSQFKCDMNDPMDVFLGYKQLCDDYLICNVISLYKTDYDPAGIEMYNVMTDPDIYNAWIMDLHDTVISVLK